MTERLVKSRAIDLSIWYGVARIGAGGAGLRIRLIIVSGSLLLGNIPGSALAQKEGKTSPALKRGNVLAPYAPSDSGQAKPGDGRDPEQLDRKGGGAPDPAVAAGLLDDVRKAYSSTSNASAQYGSTAQPSDEEDKASVANAAENKKNLNKMLRDGKSGPVAPRRQ